MPRVQRRIAVLEHHLHVAAKLTQRQPIGDADRIAIEDQFAGVPGQQMHQQPSQGGFAAAGFADDTQGLALSYGERDAVDGFHLGHLAVEDAAADREIPLQILRDQHRLGLAAPIGLGIKQMPGFGS